MIAKTEDQRERLRTAGKIMAEVVREVLALVRPGISAAELDSAARAAMEKRSAKPSFYGYSIKGSPFPYPGVINVSVNNEVVHGLPTAEKIVREGDILSLDFGLVHNGAYMDTAHTVIVGETDARGRELVDATREALEVAIAATRVGGHIGDIGAAVSAVAKEHTLGLIRILSGHGVGAAVHEEPYVPNYGKVGEGEEIEDGLVIAIEPMFTDGSGTVVLDKDGWTYRTKDGSRGAHFEHTVLITQEGVEVLTAL